MATMKLSKADLTKAAHRAESLRSRLATVRKRTEKAAEKVVHTVEVSAGAFTAGVIQGRGGIEVLGAPLELLLGGSLSLAGHLGLGGKMSDHLNGFGDGLIAGYLTQIGFGVGKTWGQPKAVPAGGGTGHLESHQSVKGIGRGADAFSDDELRSAVKAARQEVIDAG